MHCLHAVRESILFFLLFFYCKCQQTEPRCFVLLITPSLHPFYTSRRKHCFALVVFVLVWLFYCFYSHLLSLCPFNLSFCIWLNIRMQVEHSDSLWWKCLIKANGIHLYQDLVQSLCNVFHIIFIHLDTQITSLLQLHNGKALSLSYT